MKTFLVTLLAVAALGAATVALRPAKDERVRHVVVFKYKPEATPAQIATVVGAFKELPKKIPGIVSFEYGVNSSPEGKSHGFEHIFFVTFENAAARDVYLPHPAHQAFGQTLRGTGILEDVFVVDYVPGE